jgi:hypothetical protein
MQKIARKQRNKVLKQEIILSPGNINLYENYRIYIMLLNVDKRKLSLPSATAAHLWSGPTNRL